MVGSILVCLLILETGLRIAGYNPLGSLMAGRGLILRKSENPTMHYELTPNSEGIVWGAHVKINSHGFRDREYRPVKPKDVYRIGIIGDSITFGMFLELEETYPKRLEKLFEREGMRVEVLNLGIGGYDTAQEVAFLEKTGLQFSLDEVIVGYCMNDAGVASANLRYIQRVAAYDSAIYQSRVMQFLRLHLDKIGLRLRSRDSGLSANPEPIENPDVEQDDYVKERMRWIKRHINESDNYFVSLAWYADSRRIGNVVAAFDRLETLRDEYGFKVSVAIVPYLSRRLEAHDWAYEIVRHEVKRRGFYAVDLLDGFTEKGMSAVRFSRKDRIHPNVLGHRIIGDTLFDALTQNSQRIPRIP